MAVPEFATLTTDDLVTGEAVALDLPPASLGSRIGSGLIDLAAPFTPLIALLTGPAVPAAPSPCLFAWTPGRGSGPRPPAAGFMDAAMPAWVMGAFRVSPPPIEPLP